VSEIQLNSLAKALEADRAAFRVLADAIPIFVWLAREDGTIVFLSEPMLGYLGLADERAAIRNFRSLVPAPDADNVLVMWQAARAGGTCFEAELRLRRAADETYRWFLVQGRPVRDAGGQIDYWIGTATDVDAQKRATENLQFVIDASELLASGTSIEQVCTQFAQLAVRRFADWCFVMLADPQERYKVYAVAHRDAARARHIEHYLDRYPVGESSRLDEFLRAGQPVVVPEISDEILRESARDDEHLQMMRGLGLRSAIVAPLVHAGEILGAVIMYSAESQRRFDVADAEVLNTLARRAAARIHAARVLDEEQRARHRLQFIGRASQAVYESFDLTTAFGNLTQIIVSEIGDMAAVFRLEEGQAARVVGAAHRDPASDDIVRSLIGIRVMHGDAEKRFVQSLASRRPLVGTRLPAGTLEKSVWPYLSDEVTMLAPQSLVTVPLHSRGKVYGALVVYYTHNGREYKPEDLEWIVEIGRHASVALENADVFERERRMSETLQDSLLPPSLPQVEGLSFDAVYLPSATEAQVGGDWYDAFQLEDGTTVVTAGDVTGRGADAAVIMGKVRHLIAMAPSYDRDPAHILDTVESVLARRYPDAIVTAFLGFIDPAHKTMRYANAGHPAPLLRRAAGIEELHADGLPIGLRREAEPTGSCTADLSDARMLVLYTDGLTESKHDVIGGYKHLNDVLSREAVLHTHRPARFIEESCLGNAASDDVAVLTISFEPGIRWSFDAENAKAAQDARGEFVAYLRGQSGDQSSIQTAELVFGELVGNVVRHAPGAIDIDVEWSNGSPVLHVLDRGPEFKPPTKLPQDLLSESGRGLFIVRQLSKSFSVEHVPGYGNHVCVELPVARKHE
jgi:PAS domain S-box-containing protein